jgi:hypothetical protein
VRDSSVFPTPDGLGHGFDGRFLTDDPLVQLVLHAQELGGLLLGELEHRDAGPRGEDLGDLLLVDLGDHVHVAGLPLALPLGLLGQHVLLVVAQRRGLLEVLRVDRGLLVAADVGDAGVELTQVGRRGHPPDPHPGARLVDQVDRLVGQEAVGDVAVGQVGRRDQGVVGDRDPVVGLVPVAEPLQDVDRVRDRRLLDLDRLEAALEGGVLLEVLAVLLEGGRADRLELSAGQHRLEDARRVDRALGGTRPDERVQLVDEQDDVAAGADLLQDLLEALLEVTAVARPGHQRAEVEGVHLLALEGLGHLALDDGLRQPLDDGGLAHAGLADQDRVVLGPPAEHLHDPLDLLLATDDGVQLALAGVLGEVAPELVEDEGALRLGLARGGAAGPGLLAAGVAGQQLDDLLTHPGQVGPELDEDLGGHALALTDEAEQDVLGPDVVVPELERLTERQLEDLLGPWSEGDVTGRGRLTLADDLLDLRSHGLQGDAQRLKRLGGDAFTLVNQAEQDVLGPDVVVIEEPGFLLGEHDDTSCSVGKALKHANPQGCGDINYLPPVQRLYTWPPPELRTIQTCPPEYPPSLDGIGAGTLAACNRPTPPRNSDLCRLDRRTPHRLDGA